MSSWLLLILAVLTTVVLFKHLRVFYLVLKLPGPRLITTVAGLTKFFKKQQDLNSTATEILSSAPSVFRIFFGPYVHIVTSRPQDVQIICTNLKKGTLYDIFKVIIGGNTILVSNVQEWHINRKLINNSFNIKVVNSFAEIFTKQAKNLGKNLEGRYEKENKDLMRTIWHYTIRTTFETLADTELDDDIIKKIMHLAIKSEDVFVERLHSPWLNIRPIWKISTLRKQMKTIREEVEQLIYKEVINPVKNNINNNNIDSVPTDSAKKLLFLNNLFSGYNKGLISSHRILKETLLMIPASSETAAAAISFVFIVLGIYPEIQDMVYKEIVSVLDGGDKLTLKEIKQLQYLERVIKETMRIKTPIPYIGRKLDKEIFSEPFIFPSGCDVVIPIEHLHRNPEIWKDPLKFDPDRFLPEEVEKRHPCAYIPFSHGLRNCIGRKYAMLSMKCTIAEIVKNFEIKTLRPKEFADIEAVWTIVNTPKNYSIEFIKRQ